MDHFETTTRWSTKIKQILALMLLLAIAVVNLRANTFAQAERNTTESNRRVLETLLYDMFDEGTDDWVDPIPVSTTILPQGDFYLVTVSGTFSFWEVVEWESVCAGSPEALPQTPSPNTDNGLVGVDAEYIFAHPCFMYGGSELPLNIPNFEVSTDNQSSWFDPIPINPEYDRSHTYQYAIRSEGHPIAFRETDSPTDDNYGVLTIEIDSLQEKLFLPMIRKDN